MQAKPMLSPLIKLARVRQWYKNLLVFTALVFAGKLFEADSAVLALLGFASLCLVSSGNYTVNDVIDSKRDALHPEKKANAVASGKIGAYHALFFAGILYAAGLLVALSVNPAFAATAVLLAAGGLAYSLFLREKAIVDLVSIACFFVLRAVAGAVAIGAVLSPWLFLGSFVLAVFLGVLKRKADLQFMGAKASQHRKSLAGYSPKLLESLSAASVSLLLMSYSAYSFLSTKHTPFFMATIPIAFFSTFRYYLLCDIKPDICRHPERFVNDLPLLASIILWAIIVIADIYARGAFA